MNDAIEIRAASAAPTVSEDTARPRIAGHFARFGSYNEIDSVTEGRFLERIQPGAFKKTLAEQGSRIRMLFQHGRDPEIGDKPIGAPDVLREDGVGPYFEGDLFDSVPPLVVDGLRAGQYGISYRFSVIDEEWDHSGKRSDVNPLGLPTRTIRQAKVYEFGPVTFPADPRADYAVRSLTLADLDAAYAPPEPDPAPAADAALGHVEVSREADVPILTATPDKEMPTVADITQYHTREDKAARVIEIEREQETLNAQFDGVMPDEPKARWADLKSERAALLEAIEAVDERRRDLTNRSIQPTLEGGRVDYQPPTIVKKPSIENIYDVSRARREARNDAALGQTLRDNAMRSVEGASFASLEDRTSGQADIEKLLAGVDYVNPKIAAERVLHTGSPAYRRAYHKFLVQGAAGPMFTPEEASVFEETRTALVTASNVAVPYDLDSTMAINTSGAINPFRQAFRQVKTTSNDWRPLVSSGMTAVYEDEATAASDLSPAFTAPARLLVKAHTAATFSTEIQGDYPGLEAELAREIADAKDVLEATEFSTGAGTTHHPNGIFTYYTANFLDTATTLVIVPADLYKLEANIGPRYRGNTVWLGSPYFYSLVRGIDTAGGAGLWVDNMSLPNFGSMENNGRLGTLLGHPAYECLAPANTSMATTEKVAILADRDRFVIIDRIGMNIELIPNFVDTTTGYPTGQRMVYAWWRNTSVGIGLATLGAGRSSCIFRGK